MSTPRQQWMQDLRDCLAGPRRARRRLVQELDAHVDDAIAAELANGLTHDQAEAAVLARLGRATDVGLRWSADASARRWTARANLVAVGLVIAAVAAPVGLAQRSTQKPSLHVRQPARPSHILPRVERTHQQR
jgi:hypothetical protein